MKTEFYLFLSDEMGVDFAQMNSESKNIDIEIPAFNLRSNNYVLSFQINVGSTSPNDLIDKLDKAVEVNVLPGDFWKSGKVNRSGNYSLIRGEYLLD